MKKTKLEIPEFWRQPSSHAPARVMTICDGYAMLRYPSCVPFVVSIKDLADHKYGWYSVAALSKSKKQEVNDKTAT